MLPSSPSPSRRGVVLSAGEVRRYPFRFAIGYRIPQVAFGITPRTAHVDLGPDGLAVRFGPWRLRTPLDNLVSGERTGDFAYLLTVGPPHLSFADRGVSFATNAEAAACVRFRETVKGIDPTGRIRHPGATLTLLDVGAFLGHLGDLGVATG